MIQIEEGEGGGGEGGGEGAEEKREERGGGKGCGSGGEVKAAGPFLYKGCHITERGILHEGSELFHVVDRPGAIQLLFEFPKFVCREDFKDLSLLR